MTIMPVCTGDSCTHPEDIPKRRRGAGELLCWSCYNKAKTARCVAKRQVTFAAAAPPPQNDVVVSVNAPKNVADAIFLWLKRRQ